MITYIIAPKTSLFSGLFHNLYHLKAYCGTAIIVSKTHQPIVGLITDIYLVVKQMCIFAKEGH